MNIAVILPKAKSDYLAYTVLDGLMDLQKTRDDIVFYVTENFPSPFDLTKYEKKEKDFIDFANNADMVILIWGKNATNFELANTIDKWSKTVFVDGSEVGKNNRFDKNIQQAILTGQYQGIGAINFEMISKCRLYLRREKPYIDGIIAFPFGIETRYRQLNSIGAKRGIDFTCIFGQDEYPILRRQAKEYIERFSKEHGFMFQTKKTRSFSFDDNSKKAGRDEFYEILSRTKVGISIGGGGFDTARFWEILGSGAILLTEKIDIYSPEDNKLKYNRIVEFTDLQDFQSKLSELGKYLRTTQYVEDMAMLNMEYDVLLAEHSTAARVLQMINLFNK